jgi:hypothetical protein
MSMIQIDVPEEILISLKETPETMSRELSMGSSAINILIRTHCYWCRCRNLRMAMTASSPSW